jgi:hypothetical protein
VSAVWKTVRVFISSTFRDMPAERDWLVKRLFPALRQRLEPHRLNLVDIDLRWALTCAGASPANRRTTTKGSVFASSRLPWRLAANRRTSPEGLVSR